MPAINLSGLIPIATITFAMCLHGCAASGDGASERSAEAGCPAGYIMTCDVTSSGRISDGRYGYKNRQLRGRRNCGCEPQENLEGLKGETLPRDTH